MVPPTHTPSQDFAPAQLAPPAAPKPLRRVTRRISRPAIAANRSVWLATGVMYAVFALISGAATVLHVIPGTVGVALAVWLAVAAVFHLASAPPEIGTVANHLTLACVWLSVSFGFATGQPAGGMAIGGMMFVGPLIAVRLQSRTQFAVHVAGASASWLLVAASGVFAGAVDTPTVLAAGLAAFAMPVQAFTCMRILDVVEQQAEGLEGLIRRDQVTGLGNRRMFGERLDQELAGRDTAHRFTLVMLDLGGLDGTDDPSGVAEEEFLREAAGALSAAAPTADPVCRLGGDEFALLLLDAQLPERAVTQAIAAALAGVRKPTGASISVAVGSAEWPTDAMGRDELLRCADHRLTLQRTA